MQTMLFRLSTAAVALATALVAPPAADARAASLTRAPGRPRSALASQLMPADLGEQPWGPMVVGAPAHALRTLLAGAHFKFALQPEEHSGCTSTCMHAPTSVVGSRA